MQTVTNDLDDKRMYVLINRPKLTLVQAGVQAAHSVAEYAMLHGDNTEFKDWVKNYKTMIFLETDEYGMDQMTNYYSSVGKTFAKFLEPDLNNTLTAIAFEPLKNVEGKLIFGKFKLLK
jgi:hypothetical protein